MTQISLFDSELQNNPTNALHLIKQYFPLNDLIPASWVLKFYKHFGRKRGFTLSSFLWALIIQRSLSITTTDLLRSLFHSSHSDPLYHTFKPFSPFSHNRSILPPCTGTEPLAHSRPQGFGSINTLPNPGSRGRTPSIQLPRKYAKVFYSSIEHINRISHCLNIFFRNIIEFGCNNLYAYSTCYLYGHYI